MLITALAAYTVAASVVAIADHRVNGSGVFESVVHGLVVPIGALPVALAYAATAIWDWRPSLVIVFAVAIAGFAVGSHCMPEPPPPAPAHEAGR